MTSPETIAARELAEVDRILAESVPDYPAMMRRDVAMRALVDLAKRGRGEVGPLRKALEEIRDNCGSACCSRAEEAAETAEAALTPARTASPLVHRLPAETVQAIIDARGPKQ